MKKPNFSSKKEDVVQEKYWKAHGMECVVLLIGNGHRCGYVKLPPNHPAIGADEDDIAAEVHGGITYANFGLGNKDKKSYWVGFDCFHLRDNLAYWTIERVVNETEYLARQLSTLTKEQMLEAYIQKCPQWFQDMIYKDFFPLMAKYNK